MIEEETKEASITFYKVYTYGMTFKGCGSIPEQYSTDILIQTQSFELARQVFIFHLTGKTANEKFCDQHKSQIQFLFNEFGEHGSISFQQETSYDNYPKQLFLQMCQFSNSYFFDQKRVCPYMRMDVEEKVNQSELKFLEWQENKQLQKNMSDLQLYK